MIQRREFNKLAALAAASAAAQVRAQQATPAPKLAPADGITWDKAPCRFCGTGCHVRVGVKNDRVVAIEGDQLAEVNKGLLCVKGYHVGLALYGKDRLTQPLLRRNGVLEPISWEEAIETISQKILAAPDQFAIYGSGQWTIPEGYAANKFIKGGLSSNQIDPNARLCMASAVTGFLSVYGVDEPAGCYDDLDKCDVLIMWGNNMAEMHPVLFSRVMDRRTRGEKVTLIDLGTRRTRTSEFCDHYLEFRPHSDLAIMNGIAHLLIKKNAFDPKFVEKFCNFRKAPKDPLATPTAPLLGDAMSFDDYKTAMEPYTPEHVEKLSGVPAEKIRMLAGLFLRTRTSASPRRGAWALISTSRGTNANRLCHGIHLLSGHFGRPGDAPTSLTGQPSACGTAREVGTMCNFPARRAADPKSKSTATRPRRYGMCHKGRINPKIGHHTVLMWEKFCTPADKGGDIRTLWVQVTNPGQSLPNLHKLFKAKAGQPDKFLIVSDVYHTATTELADLVLPSAMWVEKNGMYGNSERRTQQWFRMVKPPGEARDDAWQMIAVARRCTTWARRHEGQGREVFSSRSRTTKVKKCPCGNGRATTT
jgi:nitrate reductase NapA